MTAVLRRAAAEAAARGAVAAALPRQSLELTPPVRYLAWRRLDVAHAGGGLQTLTTERVPFTAFADPEAEYVVTDPIYEGAMVLVIGAMPAGAVVAALGFDARVEMLGLRGTDSVSLGTTDTMLFQRVILGPQGDFRATMSVNSGVAGTVQVALALWGLPAGAPGYQAAQVARWSGGR